jgi:hypothetical protein
MILTILVFLFAAVALCLVQCAARIKRVDGFVRLAVWYVALAVVALNFKSCGG